MDYLTGALRTYPWGSRTLLAQLRGAPTPSERPEAELWFGAHHLAPSTIDGTALDAIIAADPVAALGKRVAEAFGGTLPFLVKLLAADEPLSIQAHPSRDQAREGFERENAQNVAANSAHRNYKDPNHKPELIVALTEFRALAGFRPCALTAQLFDALDCAALNRYRSMINPEDEEDSLRTLFVTWISIPTQVREDLIAAVVESAAKLEDDSGWMGTTIRAVVEINRKHPGDVGVLAALLLNLVDLAPGEALYLDAGQLHAYVRGMGVEIMANSDNVLRGGLTSKHVDVPELVRVLKFGALSDPRAEVERSKRCVDYLVPVDDFALSKHDLLPGDELEISTDGPAIILCTKGEARVGGELTLRPAQSAWIAADDPRISVTAESSAEVFYARV